MRFWHWILSLFLKEYEVTVWFEGHTTINPDGSKTTMREPKTFICKRIHKLSPKHIKLTQADKVVVEIKTVNPVGYDVKTRPWSPPTS